jgi:hypothetical protein
VFCQPAQFRISMTASGQSRRFRPVADTSALPPRADYAHDKTGWLFLGRPRRREAAGGHLCSVRSSTFFTENVSPKNQ